MTQVSRDFRRVAWEIANRLKATRLISHEITLPTETWRQLETLQRRAHRASQRGWRLAAQQLQHDLRGKLRLITHELLDIERAFHPGPLLMHVASFHDLQADLVALQAEFDGVTLDRRQRTISVTTEPIVLEGIELGPFEIELGWNRRDVGFSPNYRVIALEPNPASGNQSVTHPHVQDEGLCEGEGRSAIRDALEQGRLFDFFVIVANLLRNYNSGSPYIALANWRGFACGDCGDSVTEEDDWTCDRCGTLVCGACNIQCLGCQEAYCHSCVSRCTGCQELHCQHCLRPCSSCQTEFCSECLDDNERCDTCHAAELADESHETTETVEVAAEA